MCWSNSTQLPEDAARAGTGPEGCSGLLCQMELAKLSVAELGLARNLELEGWL